MITSNRNWHILLILIITLATPSLTLAGIWLSVSQQATDIEVTEDFEEVDISLEGQLEVEGQVWLEVDEFVFEPCPGDETLLVEWDGPVTITDTFGNVDVLNGPLTITFIED